MHRFQYYIVSPRSNIYKKFQEWTKATVQSREDMQKYIESSHIGDYLYDREGLKAVKYSPHKKVPVSVRADKDQPGYYVPNLRKKAGKEMAKTWAGFAWKGPTEAAELLRHQPFVSTNSRGTVMVSARLWRSSTGVVVACIPVNADLPYNPPPGLYEIPTTKFQELTKGAEMDVPAFIKQARGK